MDKIEITLTELCPYKQEIINNKAYISAEVLAEGINVVEKLTTSHEIEIDNVTFEININKI